jgi:hypothetical protein
MLKLMLNSKSLKWIDPTQDAVQVMSFIIAVKTFGFNKNNKHERLHLLGYNIV